ncbi:MAG: zf-HC2 domain-containing protein [Chloroflexi bacterium]|nr:zf-HC2 domain-containing protein [Chloroflexota bacterium]
MRLPLLQFGHERWQEQLSASLDGRLEEREQAALERHLAGCARCREELAQLRATVALLRRMPAVPPPRSFVLRPEDVAVKADRPVDPPPAEGWLRPGSPFRAGMRWATAAAALLLIGVVTYDVSVTVVAPGGAALRDASIAMPLAAPASAPDPKQQAEDGVAITAAQAPPASSQEQDAAAPGAPERAATQSQPAEGAGVGQYDLKAPGEAGGAPPSPTPAPGPGLSLGDPGPRAADTEWAYTTSGQERRPAALPLAPLRLLEVALGIVVVAGAAALWWGRPRAP